MTAFSSLVFVVVFLRFDLKFSRVGSRCNLNRAGVAAWKWKWITQAIVHGIPKRTLNVGRWCGVTGPGGHTLKIRFLNSPCAGRSGNAPTRLGKKAERGLASRARHSCLRHFGHCRIGGIPVPRSGPTGGVGVRESAACDQLFLLARLRPVPAGRRCPWRPLSLTDCAFCFADHERLGGPLGCTAADRVWGWPT